MERDVGQFPSGQVGNLWLPNQSLNVDDSSMSIGTGIRLVNQPTALNFAGVVNVLWV